MKYVVSYRTGEEREFKSFKEAIRDIRNSLETCYTKGWFVSSNAGLTDDSDIEKDFSLTRTGNKEWLIGRDINVSNSWREFAYIEEIKE